MEEDIESNNINPLISLVRSEESIIQTVSEQINKQISEQASSSKDSIDNIAQTDQCSLLKAALENQVRIGEITPIQAAKKEAKSKKAFGISEAPAQFLDLEKYLLQQAELSRQKKLAKKNKNSDNKQNDTDVSSKKLKLSNKEITNKTKNKSIVKKKATVKENKDFNNDEKHSNTSKSFSENNVTNDSESEYLPSDDYDSDEDSELTTRRKVAVIKQKSSLIKRVLDDGDEDVYKQRVQESNYNKKESLHKVDKSFKVPQSIWKKLFKYQKVSVRWLWELHSRNLGGLIGDEMGLGKTVQVIAFLAGLDCSELLLDGGRFRGLGPTLIICPATLLEQWVSHFHEWWPTLRCAVLHHSGTFQGKVEDLLESLRGGGILVTSYSGVLIHEEILLKSKWHYVILDEGHKIRNPDAKISKVVKKFLTPHRLLLTGSPMQNSLKELWSLFDFILPGKLGTLPAFMEHCANPIVRGGYSNASRLQEATALQVATMLKNAITPYMLRRTKYDVQHHVALPEKNEQVLFCSLTDEQKNVYNQFLKSDEVAYVLHDRNESGRYKAKLLVALTALRKICNHPDLFLLGHEKDSDEDVEVDESNLKKFGYWKRSGKMAVVRSLLKIWKKQGHRVLLFTQSRQMMYILESLLQKEDYKYLVMDGMTPMSQRQLMISKFNNDESHFVFLLTTKVGGLGVNLTGANRVIIYDPDWNPATDAQARERAWRIGQEKNVTVYRLITAGTIEEKIYHRQVYKTILSNRVLEDPRQKRLFRTSDLRELFNLNEPVNGDASESDQLFQGSKVTLTNMNFSSDKIQAMHKLASTLSKKIKDKNFEKSLATKNENKTSKEIENSPLKENSSKNDAMKNNIDDEAITNSTDVKDLKISEEIINDCKSKESLTNINPENKITSEIADNILNTEINKPSCSHVKEKKRNFEQMNENSIADEIEDGEINEESEDFKKPNTENRSVKRHKSKHKKNKKSKKEVSAMFEGERISFLIGRRLNNNKSPEVISDDDKYVLTKLFSKAAVSSAFKHESVLSNKSLINNEETPLEKAAKESALEKLNSVKESRKWCWRPCWNDETDDS